MIKMVGLGADLQLGKAEIFPTHVSVDSKDGKGAKVMNIPNLVSNACVVGPYSVLLGLGNIYEIYKLAWLIPPILPFYPSCDSSNIKISTYCGISFDTSIGFTNPNMNSIRHLIYLSYICI